MCTVRWGFEGTRGSHLDLECPKQDQFGAEGGLALASVTGVSKLQFSWGPVSHLVL